MAASSDGFDFGRSYQECVVKWQKMQPRTTLSSSFFGARRGRSRSDEIGVAQAVFTELKRQRERRKPAVEALSKVMKALDRERERSMVISSRSRILQDVVEICKRAAEVLTSTADALFVLFPCVIYLIRKLAECANDIERRSSRDLMDSLYNQNRPQAAARVAREWCAEATRRLGELPPEYDEMLRDNNGTQSTVFRQLIDASRCRSDVEGFPVENFSVEAAEGGDDLRRWLTCVRLDVKIRWLSGPCTADVWLEYIRKLRWSKDCAGERFLVEWRMLLEHCTRWCNSGAAVPFTAEAFLLMVEKLFTAGEIAPPTISVTQVLKHADCFGVFAPERRFDAKTIVEWLLQRVVEERLIGPDQEDQAWADLSQMLHYAINAGDRSTARHIFAFLRTLNARLKLLSRAIVDPHGSAKNREAIQEFFEAAHAGASIEVAMLSTGLSSPDKNIQAACAKLLTATFLHRDIDLALQESTTMLSVLELISAYRKCAADCGLEAAVHQDTSVIADWLCDHAAPRILRHGHCHQTSLTQELSLMILYFATSVSPPTLRKLVTAAVNECCSLRSTLQTYRTISAVLRKSNSAEHIANLLKQVQDFFLTALVEQVVDLDHLAEGLCSPNYAIRDVCVRITSAMIEQKGARLPDNETMTRVLDLVTRYRQHCSEEHVQASAESIISWLYTHATARYHNRCTTDIAFRAELAQLIAYDTCTLGCSKQFFQKLVERSLDVCCTFPSKMDLWRQVSSNLQDMVNHSVQNSVQNCFLEAFRSTWSIEAGDLEQGLLCEDNSIRDICTRMVVAAIFHLDHLLLSSQSSMASALQLVTQFRRLNAHLAAHISFSDLVLNWLYTHTTARFRSRQLDMSGLCAELADLVVYAFTTLRCNEQSFRNLVAASVKYCGAFQWQMDLWLRISSHFQTPRDPVPKEVFDCFYAALPDALFRAEDLVWGLSMGKVSVQDMCARISVDMFCKRNGRHLASESTTRFGQDLGNVIDAMCTYGYLKLVEHSLVWIAMHYSDWVNSGAEGATLIDLFDHRNLLRTLEVSPAILAGISSLRVAWPVPKISSESLQLLLRSQDTNTSLPLLSHLQEMKKKVVTNEWMVSEGSLALVWWRKLLRSAKREWQRAIKNQGPLKDSLLRALANLPNLIEEHPEPVLEWLAYSALIPTTLKEPWTLHEIQPLLDRCEELRHSLRDTQWLAPDFQWFDDMCCEEARFPHHGKPRQCLPLLRCNRYQENTL